MSQVVLASSAPQLIPRWLHAWAILTVCATVPLLFLGADVTSMKVGMADPVWPTYPWHLALVSWQDSGLGFLIEHGHRAVGYLVGMCVIVLALGLWFAQPRRLLKWLGMAALLAVIAQGLLGGFRVRLNALVGTDLALVHGLFAQLVFALFASLVTLTSPQWDESETAPAAGDPDHLGFWSLLTTVLIGAQLVLGALVRHTHLLIGQRGHLLLAFAVVALVVKLIHLTQTSRPSDRHLARLATLLLILVGAQILLGVESWMIRFGSGPLADYQPATIGQALVRTGHFVAGSAILATSVVTTLWVHHQALHELPWADVPIPSVEGAP